MHFISQMRFLLCKRPRFWRTSPADHGAWPLDPTENFHPSYPLYVESKEFLNKLNYDSRPGGRTYVYVMNALSKVDRVLEWNI